MIKGRISVVIPVYNGADYIEKTINSIQRQTAGDVELIIVEDCSTDSSREILKKIANGKSSLKIIFNEQNCGLQKTANRGAAAATGEYLMVCGQDDLFAPEHLELMIKLIDEDTAFVHCNSIIIDENDNQKNNLKKTFLQHIKTYWFHRFIYLDNYISSCGLLMNKKKFDKIGGYIEEYRNFGEWMLWIRLGEIGKVKFNNKIKAYYRIHSKNMSKGIFKKSQKNDLLLEYYSKCRNRLKIKNKNILDKIFYFFSDILIFLKNKIK